jgi:hypothetical protein
VRGVVAMRIDEGHYGHIVAIIDETADEAAA